MTLSRRKQNHKVQQCVSKPVVRGVTSKCGYPKTRAHIGNSFSFHFSLLPTATGAECWTHVGESSSSFSLFATGPQPARYWCSCARQTSFLCPCLLQSGSQHATETPHDHPSFLSSAAACASCVRYYSATVHMCGTKTETSCGVSHDPRPAYYWIASVDVTSHSWRSCGI